MMGPDEDPRIRGNDIPKFLYKVEPRLSEKSPTSPSIDGFKATTSGMYRTAASRDAFPTTREDYELFLGEYCDLMNNPIHHDTSTHLHFVGFYTTRSLAEKEAALMRTNGLTYRVYCVRGDCLTEFVSSVVKGRSVVTIGRSTNAETIHTDPQVGEEFLVWGRVPPEALVGSWGADGMLQYASVRRAFAVQRGPAAYVPYIETHEEMSEEEVFELADAAANASMIERRNQQTRSVHRQLHNTSLRTSGLGTSSNLGRNLSPHSLSSRSLDPPNFLRPPTSSHRRPTRILPPPTAMGRPPGLSRMHVQLSTSSHPAQAFQSMASAPPPPPPSFNSTGRMYLDSRLPQQAPTYRSPYGPLGQMDGSSDEPDDGENRVPQGPVWAQWTLNSTGKTQVPGSNANARSTNTSSERPSSTGSHNNQVSSAHTETVASPAIDQQQLSENAPAPAPTPSPATSSHPAGPNRSALLTGRTPLPSQPRTARSAPLLAFGPSSDDERAAREEEEYRRQREGVPRISPTQGAGTDMQAPTQGPSSAPAPVKRTPLPSSRPPVRNGGLPPDTPAQTRSDPPLKNPSSVETGNLASPYTPRSTAPLGSPGSLPQNPPPPDGLQLPASGPSYCASIARCIPTSSREGPYHSPYSNGPAPVTAQQAVATAITSSSTAPAASVAVPRAANVPAMDMTFPGAHYVLSPAAQVPFGNPAPPFRPQIQFQVQQPRQRRGSSLAETYRELHEWRAKIRDFRGLPPLGDRSQPSTTSAPSRPRPQNDQSGSGRGRGRGRKRPSGDSYIQEITKQEVKRMIAELKEEYNAMAGRFQPLPSIFSLAEDNFLPPPNPLAIHPDFERESTPETTARRQWLNHRHTRLEAGRHAYVQGRQGTPSGPVTFEHDGEEIAQALMGILHDRPRHTPAGGMQNLHQLNFQGPAVPQPPYANSFGPNPYGSRSSMANPFGPNPHNPQTSPAPGYGRGGMASSMGRGGTMASNFNTPTNPNLAPPPMRFFNQSFGTQNGLSKNPQPRTALPKPKSEKSKPKKTKIKTEPEAEVNPFTD